MDDMRPGTTTVVTAPPPPSEVKIRTMKSDLAMLAASGGGLPHYANIKVDKLTTARNEAPAENPVRSQSKNNLALILVLLVALAAFVVIGWLVYLKFHTGG